MRSRSAEEAAAGNHDDIHADNFDRQPIPTFAWSTTWKKSSSWNAVSVSVISSAKMTRYSRSHVLHKHSGGTGLTLAHCTVQTCCAKNLQFGSERRQQLVVASWAAFLDLDSGAQPAPLLCTLLQCNCQGQDPDSVIASCQVRPLSSRDLETACKLTSSHCWWLQWVWLLDCFTAHWMRMCSLE